jgi:hypothetical protein
MNKMLRQIGLCTFVAVTHEDSTQVPKRVGVCVCAFVRYCADYRHMHGVNNCVLVSTSAWEVVCVLQQPFLIVESSSL